MKPVLLCFLFVALWSGCLSSDNAGISKRNEMPDTVTVDFLKRVCAINPDDTRHVVLLVNSSFCGSCTEKVRLFLKEIAPLPCRKCFIIANPDSAVTHIAQNARNSTPVSVLPDTLARYDLLNPYSKMYVFQDTHLVYNTSLVEESLPLILNHFLESNHCSANP
ncbi:MAG: hypothetical protein IPM47_09410 [Sphingobacteriales bacterium]|nr:MAG: hypothetical protein IPM47_09410 [Sphingobacteriales bacterium]